MNNTIGKAIGRLLAALAFAGMVSFGATAQTMLPDAGATTTIATPNRDSTPQAATDMTAPETAPSASSASLLPKDLSPWGMFLTATLVVKAVMIGLVFASCLTWTVALAKGVELFAAKRRLRAQIAIIERSTSLAEAVQRLEGGGAVAAAAKAALAEMQMSMSFANGAGVNERIRSRLERLEAAAGRRTARGMGILATIGATAPFVGLFGTVWGIMNSFIGISKEHTTNLAVVAPGIAEALLATALGLVAAIPAVVIYNMFARAFAERRALHADATAEIARLASRDLDRAGARGVPARASLASAAE